MKTRQQRSNHSYSAVLAHASYACLEAENFETQLRELAIGMKVLCDEYGVDLAEAVLPANDATENAQPNCAGGLDMANIETHMEGWVCSDCGHAWTFMEVEDGHAPDNCPNCQDFNALWSEACSRGVSSPREAALYVFLSLREKADGAEAKQVIIPATPTVEILTAMSVALGIEPLTDGSDGSYPITGAQSTVRQCYAAIVRTTEPAPTQSAPSN